MRAVATRWRCLDPLGLPDAVSRVHRSGSPSPWSSLFREVKHAICHQTCRGPLPPSSDMTPFSSRRSGRSTCFSILCWCAGISALLIGLRFQYIHNVLEPKTLRRAFGVLRRLLAPASDSDVSACSTDLVAQSKTSILCLATVSWCCRSCFRLQRSRSRLLHMIHCLRCHATFSLILQSLASTSMLLWTALSWPTLASLHVSA